MYPQLKYYYNCVRGKCREELFKTDEQLQKRIKSQKKYDLNRYYKFNKKNYYGLDSVT